MRLTIAVRDCYMLRERLNLTQEALARKAKLSKNMYARIEQGRSDPSPQSFWRLVQALNTTPERLQRGAKAMSAAWEPPR